MFQIVMNSMKTGQNRNCVVNLQVAKDTSIACTTGNGCNGGGGQPLQMRVFCHREYGSAEWLQAKHVCNCNQDCTVSQEVRGAAFDARFLSGHSGRRHHQLVKAVSGLTGEDQWH